MNPVELMILAFSLVLLLVMIVGSLRLKTLRRVSLGGIEDAEAIEAYDRVNKMPQFALIRRVFIRELKKQPLGQTITDIGCGPGYLLQAIAQELPEKELTGVDISKEMIGRARTNFRSMGSGGRVEFRQGSAENLPFDDDTQDFIVSTFSLHHWVDPQHAFSEIYRVLKPGGQMLIFDLRRDARRMFLWLMWFAQNIALRIIGADVLRKINEPMGSLFASYTVAELKQIMSKTSFSNHKIKGKLGWMYLWAEK